MNYSLGSNVFGNLSYGYDTAGRRAGVSGNFARTGLPLAVSIANYNANNELTGWGTANLFYDANGNMTSDGTHSYAWDARNRLSQIDSGNTASFVYDPMGRRVSKNILGTSTNFLYDGANVVQELSGTTPTANLLSGGVDEEFQRTDLAGARSLLTDALGSTLALADSSGTLQTTYSFEPFGNASASGSATTNSFAYTGRELDATGLQFNRARYYHPQLERFISEDPLGFLGRAVNLYQYARSSPISYFDPLGLSAESGRKPRPCGPDGYRDADPDDAAVVLQEAQSYQGVPYRSGAGPNSNYDGTDCSGLVYNAVSNSGINSSIGYSQANDIASNPGYRPLGPNEARMPGDVVVFPVSSPGHGHTGFYDPADSPLDFYSAMQSQGVGSGKQAWFPGGANNAHFYRVRVPCDP